MFRPKREPSSGGAGPRPRRTALVAAIFVALAAAAVVVNRPSFELFYYARAPLPALVARAGAGAEPALTLLAGSRLLEAGRAAEARSTLLRLDGLPLAATPEYRRLLGQACLAAGEPKEAFGHFQVALSLAPDDPEVHLGLGDLLRRSGKEEEAAARYRKAVELAPDLGEGWLRLGELAQAKGQHAKALGLLERAEKRVRSAASAMLRAEALEGMGRFDEAVASARTALAREPAAASYLLLGRLLAARPEDALRREAVTLLTHAAALAPESRDAYRELGLACRTIGEHRAAVRALRAHLRLDPGAVRSYPPLAQSYRELQRPDLAAAVLRVYRSLEAAEMRSAQAEYVLAARERSPDARLELARTYAQHGMEDRARSELESLLTDVPGHDAARRLLASLPAERSLAIPPLPPDPENDP
jgi:tetratricopeptide (TPR) repeat protein